MKASQVSPLTAAVLTRAVCPCSGGYYVESPVLTTHFDQVYEYVLSLLNTKGNVRVTVAPGGSSVMFWLAGTEPSVLP